MGETDNIEKAFADGLYRILEPAVLQCDETMKEVVGNQLALSEHLDRLISSIEEFKSSTKEIDISSYTNKLVATKKRLGDVSYTVDRIYTRLVNLKILIKKKEMAHGDITDSSYIQSTERKETDSSITSETVTSVTNEQEEFPTEEETPKAVEKTPVVEEEALVVEEGEKEAPAVLTDVPTVQDLLDLIQ